MKCEHEKKTAGWNGKIIALDIGGVCISLHFEKLYKALELEYSSPQTALLMDAGKQLGCGRINEQEWLDMAVVILEGRFSQSYIRDAWNMILGPAIPGERCGRISPLFKRVPLCIFVGYVFYAYGALFQDK